MRRKDTLILVVTLTIVSLFIYWQLQNVASLIFSADTEAIEVDPYVLHAPPSLPFSSTNSTLPLTVRVLWWTHSTWEHGIPEGWVDDPCLLTENISCYVTLDKEQITSLDTDMVVFHPRFPGERNSDGVPKEVYELNARRPVGQWWMLQTMESPINDQVTMNPHFMQFFTYYSSYRRTTDLLDAYYEHWLWDYKLTTDFVFNMPVAIEDKRKDAAIVWYASNCDAQNGRSSYVRELMQHIDVHSYGKCEKTVDSTEDIFTVIPRYKFYLSFENTNCEDYVSEKFWRTLFMGLVPVVMGAPNIHDFQPTAHSVIRVSDFPSPLALARHLHYLHHNDSAYKEYLSYKFDRQLSPSFMELFKSPCRSTKANMCRFTADLKTGRKVADRHAGLRVDDSCG